ncbi:MAG: DUF1365 domain-containing protein [Cellvibrio sp.]
MVQQFASAIYSGKVRHRRFSPKQHAFEYNVFMMYLDTSEIEKIFSLSPWWSLSHFSPVQYKRSDFHIDQKNLHNKNLPSVDESIRNTVESATDKRPTGPIRMLVNLRYWGFNMNPLSTYYCFDDAGEKIIAILAEVHNTPWNERHAYVLTGEDFSNKQHISFHKEFHVSPFNPIEMDYHWHSSTPGKTLALHLENWQGQQKIMDATMTLAHESITPSSLNKILIRFPWMTVKIIMAIYWQALKLWWKRVPIFDHAKDAQKPNYSTRTQIKIPVKIQEETKHEIH